MSVTAAKVMELREATGVGMMDCKRALEETGGDMAKASEYLRKKGISIAAKKSARETREGAVAIAMADDRRAASIVRVACETDFVARNDQFHALLGRLTAQVLRGGDRDVARQPLMDGNGTVQELITDHISRIGENIQLMEAHRVELSRDGLVGGYVHSNHKIGVLVALQSAHAVPRERLEPLAKDLAMHIAASQVSAITPDQLDPAMVAQEKEIFEAQARESGKPANVIAKMVEGKLQKYVKEQTLLNQPFVKDPDKRVEQLLQEKSRELGAEIAVARYVKLQV